MKNQIKDFSFIQQYSYHVKFYDRLDDQCTFLCNRRSIEALEYVEKFYDHIFRLEDFLYFFKYLGYKIL